MEELKYNEDGFRDWSSTLRDKDSVWVVIINGDVFWHYSETRNYNHVLAFLGK